MPPRRPLQRLRRKRNHLWLMWILPTRGCGPSCMRCISLLLAAAGKKVDLPWMAALGLKITRVHEEKKRANEADHSGREEEDKAARGGEEGRRARAGRRG